MLDIVDKIPVPRHFTLPPPAQLPQMLPSIPPPPPTSPIQQQETKRRGRPRKTVAPAPATEPSPVSYALRSRTTVTSPEASSLPAAAPARSPIIVPQFSSSHSPAYEGGGNDVPTTTTTIDTLKGKQTKVTQKKEKKHSNKAWSEI
jgi:hypothetical protein